MPQFARFHHLSTFTVNILTELGFLYSKKVRSVFLDYGLPVNQHKIQHVFADFRISGNVKTSYTSRCWISSNSFCVCLVVMHLSTTSIQKEIFTGSGMRDHVFPKTVSEPSQNSNADSRLFNHGGKTQGCSPLNTTVSL